MLREMTNVVPHQHSSVTTSHQMSAGRKNNMVNGHIHISIKRKKKHAAHVVYMRHFASNALQRLHRKANGIHSLRS